MKKAFSLFFLTFILSAFLVPVAANAGQCVFVKTPAPAATTCSTDADCTTLDTSPGVKCDTSAGGGGSGSGSGSTSTTALTNPIGTKICAATESGQQCIQHVLGSVIKTAMGIVGSIALLMAVWGGFLWLTSMGNESRVETGKKTLIWAILGLVLIFGAYALTTYIFTAITTPAK
jgi:Type IV secretion system pilin